MKNKINSLCHQLLSGGIPRSRALTGFLLAMCSNTQADSVVQLSLSPFFQHQYSSITDLLSCLGENEATLVKVRKLFRQLATSVLLSGDVMGAQATLSERLLLSVDVTPCVHPFAHTLAERKAVALLADDKPGLSDSALVVLTADSGYGNVPFLLPLRSYNDLVAVVPPTSWSEDVRGPPPGAERQELSLG